MSDEKKVNTLCDMVEFNTDWEAQMGKEYQQYRVDWKENTINRNITPFPMHLDVDITNACALACSFCPRTAMINKGMYPGNYFMSWDVFTKAVGEGGRKGLKALNLNASGEPLLHRDLIKMISFAKEQGILDIMMHTSAASLTESKAEALIDSGLTKLIVSFDSPVKEHYEKLRVNASFDKVVSSINQIVELKKKNDSITPYIRINMVVMRENEHEKQMMVDMWKDKVDGVAFLTYINQYGEQEDNNRGLKPMVFKEGFVCEKPWQRLAISHDGKIKFCHLDDMDEVILGDLESMSIEDAWQGAQMNSYRQKHLDGNIRDIELCSKCSVPCCV